ncbi:MAG: PHB depolymerase family esterase [Pseudomonadota bacterium]
MRRFRTGFALQVMAGFAVMLTTLMVAPPALANCEIGGQEIPCETRNGHYRIRTPDGPGPHPTVLYLYGSTGNSARTLAWDGFVRSFVDRGYAVIVPAGLDKRYVGGLVDSGWFLRNSRARKKRDDTAFVAEVLADAALRHRIDRDRVLIAGMSNGGFLAWEIACHNPELAAAYAPIAAGYLGAMPNRCRKGVRLLHTHGRADQVVPLAPDKAWKSGGARMTPLDQALGKIAKAGGCVNRASPERLREFTLERWGGCIPGASVELLTHNGGHTIPLSWYSVVVDWFEKGRSASPGASGGGTARFQGVGSRDTSRFKKPKFVSE